MGHLKYIQEKTYDKSPLWLQNLLINIEGRRINNRRYSREFFEVFSRTKIRENYTNEEFETYIINRLRHNLIQAYENSDYYKNLFFHVNFSPHKFDHREQLKTIPVQTKQTLKENLDLIKNKNIKKKSYFMAHTSGTTGSGLIFPQSKMCEYEQWATWWRYRWNIGIKFDLTCGYFGGRPIVPTQQKKPPYYRHVKSSYQVMFSMYHLNQSTVKHYIDELNRRKIKWIHGYPSFISHLSTLMVENNLNLDYDIEFITTGAENLLEHQVKTIERAFGVIPFQHYGLQEPVANISECPYHKLHIDEDYSYVELIPYGIDNKYKIIGTSLTNDAMLFLRYDTNDIITLSQNQDCECNNRGRIVQSIDGRKEDFIVLQDGTKLGRLDHIFKDMVNIRESQIIQNTDGGISVYIVRTKKFSNRDEGVLRKELEYRFRNHSFEIIFKDSIKKTENGKLRFVISRYNPDS